MEQTRIVTKIIFQGEAFKKIWKVWLTDGWDAFLIWITPFFMSSFLSIPYKVCPEGIQPCNMKTRDIYWRRYKIQETLHTGQWCLSLLQGRDFGTSHSSPNHNQLPHHYFPESHWWSEISSLSNIVFEKARSHRMPNLGCSGAESPGWFDVSPKISAWDVMHEQAHCCDEAANQWLPIAAAFWIVWIIPTKECSSLAQNLMQVCCSTHSVILNVTTTQYTCSLKGIYCPH